MDPFTVSNQCLTTGISNIMVCSVPSVEKWLYNILLLKGKCHGFFSEMSQKLFDMMINKPMCSSGVIDKPWKKGRKCFLFNDALKTFYLRLYGVGHMVKDHSDSERGNPLPPHRLLFPISSKGSIICIIPQTG